MIIDREKLAWSAGFFSGEGSTLAINTHPRHRPRKRLQVSIAQAEIKALEQFLSAFPPGLVPIHGPYKNGIEGRKQIWEIRTAKFEIAQYMVAAMWPWLSEIKKAQATKALKAVAEDRKRPHGNEKDLCLRGHNDWGPYTGIKTRRRICLTCEKIRRGKI